MACLPTDKVYCFTIFNGGLFGAILCSGGNFDILIWMHIIGKNSILYELNLQLNAISFIFSNFPPLPTIASKNLHWRCPCTVPKWDAGAEVRADSPASEKSSSLGWFCLHHSAPRREDEVTAPVRPSGEGEGGGGKAKFATNRLMEQHKPSEMTEGLSSI